MVKESALKYVGSVLWNAWEIFVYLKIMQEIWLQSLDQEDPL